MITKIPIKTFPLFNINSLPSFESALHLNWLRENNSGKLMQITESTILGILFLLSSSCETKIQKIEKTVISNGIQNNCLSKLLFNTNLVLYIYSTVGSHINKTEIKISRLFFILFTAPNKLCYPNHHIFKHRHIDFVVYIIFIFFFYN